MSEPPEFPKLDSASPEFWDVRYRAHFTPWDAGDVPQQVRQFVAQQRRSLRVLVPGCGSGYEIVCFAEAGWDVLGIDFSATALEEAQGKLGGYAALTQHADFFELSDAQGFDAIYERTFLCALKPSLRADYALQLTRLMRPGGLLFGYFYYDDKAGGPPFAIATSELEALLSTDFTRLVAADVADSIPLFQGKERWEIWQHRG